MTRKLPLGGFLQWQREMDRLDQWPGLSSSFRDKFLEGVEDDKPTSVRPPAPSREEVLAKVAAAFKRPKVHPTPSSSTDTECPF